MKNLCPSQIALLVPKMERKKTDDDLFNDQGAFAIDALESWIGIEKVPTASCYNHQLDHHS